jgi:hypothetical protein
MLKNLLLILLLTVPCLGHADTATANKYPPYPEVWDWVVPDQKAFIPPWLHAHLLDNGDVLLLYSMQGKAEKKTQQASPSKPDLASVDRKLMGLICKATGKPGQAEGELVIGQITLFGKQTVVNQPSNVHIMRNKDQPIQLSDGSLVRILKSDDDSVTSYLPLTDGSVISSRGTHLKDCFIGPGNSWFVRLSEIPKPNQPPPKELTHKIVFYLLDEPKIWEGAYYENCEESEHRLIVRVEPIQGTVLPLNDGTFLLVNSSRGLIIRFDKDFQTHSPLLNRKIFVFDQDEYSDGMFIDKITGKKYWEQRGEQIYSKNQEALDDLYNYLISIKREHE